MMIQPFIAAIVTHGEYSLMLFDGEFSHAVVQATEGAAISGSSRTWRE